MFSVKEIESASSRSSRIVAKECKVYTNKHVYKVGAYLPAENNVKMYRDELSLLQDF